MRIALSRRAMHGWRLAAKLGLMPQQPCLQGSPVNPLQVVVIPAAAAVLNETGTRLQGSVPWC